MTYCITLISRAQLRTCHAKWPFASNVFVPASAGSTQATVLFPNIMCGEFASSERQPLVSVVFLSSSAFLPSFIFFFVLLQCRTFSFQCRVRSRYLEIDLDVL